MSELVTVIIPVYNVEQYVERCIQSVLKQTYVNMEILIINDGSTDSSRMICDRISRTEPRIRLIDKKNGGLSSARNVGLAHANGKLITFIDSDDWIETDFVEQLVLAITKSQADISTFHVKKEKKSGYSPKVVPVTQDDWQFYSSRQALKQLFTDNQIGYGATSKMYRTSLFLDNGILFPVGMLMEDKATTYKLIDRAKHGVIVSTLEKYHYFIRTTGIMKRTFTEKRFDSFVIHDQIMEYMQVRHPELLVLVKQRYVYEAFRMLMALVESQNQQLVNFKKCNNVIGQYGGLVLKDKGKNSVIYRTMIRTLVKFPGLTFKLARSRVVSRVFKELEVW